MALKTIRLDQLPQPMDLQVVEGDDLAWEVGIQQGEPLVPLPWAGATIVAKVVNPYDDTVSENIAHTEPVDGTTQLSLTEVQTGALGPGTFTWWIQVTLGDFSMTYARGALAILNRETTE